MDHTTPEGIRKLRRFAYAYVTVITLFALLFAALLVSVANDVYAFVKPDRAMTLTVDTPMTLSEISRLLSEGGIVNNPTMFQLYTKAKGKQARVEGFSGELTLNASMSYRELLLAFAVE